ncbi:hypothetical protein E4T56_gene12016 [Termitomyces sp. T112]|nr:hypothetical protein E4T56_gene12016 [Termitomyces sp. T112]
MSLLSQPVPRNPAHRPSTPRTPKKTPNTPPNFRSCPAPISANSNASLANSDGPLANFSAFPAATDTYPGPPEPQEPPPLFPIFATHHQLNILVPPTYSRVSRQPRGNPRSPMIPSTYQRGTILDHNQHPPTLSSSAKPRRHSRRTPKSSGSHDSIWPLCPSLHQPKRPHKLRNYDYEPRHSFTRSEPRSSLGPGLPQLQMISHQTPAPFPLITQPPTPSLPRISRMAFCLNPAKTISFPHNLTSLDLPGSVWITSPQLSAQAISARNVFKCLVTSARRSCPPSKDSPSAAEPPRSAEPDTCHMRGEDGSF